MTDYAATSVAANAGTVVVEHAGTAAADTIAAGSQVLWRNTGAGTHAVVITTNNTVTGLPVGDRTISLAAGQNKSAPIPREWGDVNGKCAIAIDGTAAEVKFSVTAGGL